MPESRLREKDTRMPDIEAPGRDKIVRDYLEKIQGLSEPARSQRFTLLLRDLFGDIHPRFIEEYLGGVEKSLRAPQTDLVLRGRADALFGNVVVEFERDLTDRRRMEEAQEQLRRYVAILWSGEPPDARTPYLCIATDGVRFYAWTPVLDDSAVRPEAVRLESVDGVDASQLERPGDLYFWLDRYLLRKERMSPRTENIVRDFGPGSHAFHVVARDLMALWKRVRARDEFAVLYDTWEKYLRIVYGSAQADDELFIRHTYLATLAKLMAWARLADGAAVTAEVPASVLEGRFFKDLGIDNFLEEDFFSWPVRGAARTEGVETARRLAHLLRTYHLRGLSEDVLKSLYQDLVDPRTRHDLGEYYTPDWLAARIVRRLLDENPTVRLLDPACGSGTFLYQAVREKRERLGDSPETLEHILTSVVGIDIHPLAVIIARTNYLLALGDLVRRRRSRVTVPVYLADAIRLPEWVIQGRMEEATSQWLPAGYEVKLDGETVHLPQALLEEPALYDSAVEAARKFAVEWTGRAPTLDHFVNYLKAGHPALAEMPAEVQASLFAVAEALRRRMEANRDTIWAFVLRNSYRPLFLRHQFDRVMGNPPWLSYRYVEQPDYQAFLKDQITGTYRLLSGRGELITQMDLGTYFLLRAADLYLKEEGGVIAFVLPKSIFSADQHDALRRETFRPEAGLGWTELWDLEEVEPLFNVPACVLFGVRGRRGAADEGIPGEVLSGRLPRRNASLAEAEGTLGVQRTRFFLNRRGRRSFWATAATPGGLFSPYRDRFYQGATIVPRALWFVEIPPSPLGFNPDSPPLRTARRAREEAKDAYRDLVMEGNVEARFLYATLLSTDLVPFGHLDYRLVVLPIEPEGDHYRMLTAEEARKRGFLGLAKWLERAQAEWARRRGLKAERMSIYERLDHVRGLTRQNPQAKYRVTYPDINRVMFAVVVRTDEPIQMQIGGQGICVGGYVTDCKNYCCETDSEEEAQYLCAVLNSPAVDALLRPFRRREQRGHPDVHKKIFDVAHILPFDPSRGEHRRLAELGRACNEKVSQWLAGARPEGRSIGPLRAAVRDLLRAELAEIDACTRQVLERWSPAGAG
jgi:methylase of polypeptide subunit release factors